MFVFKGLMVLVCAFQGVTDKYMLAGLCSEADGHSGLG